MRVMTDPEENIVKAFGFRRVKFMPSDSTIDKLHEALETYTREEYKPRKKPLEDKVLDILKLHPEGSEWDIKTMRKHLYFFHRHNYSNSYISKVLKNLAEKNVIEKTGYGRYKKAA